MPAGQPIDSIFDEGAIQKQLTTVSAGVQGLINQMLALLKIGEELSVTLPDSLPGANPKAAAGLTALQKAQKAYTQSLAENNTEIQKLRIQTQQNNAVAKQNAKEVLGQVNAYEKLKAQVVAAAYNAKVLNATFGAGSDQAKKASKEYETLSGKLASIEAAANKGNSGVNALGKGFSLIRQAAYLLPGIGIAGIFNLIGEGAIAAYKSIVQGKDALNGFKAVLTSLNEVEGNANKEAGKQIADLKILYTAATDVNLAMGDRIKAVHTLKDEFPDYFKAVGDETILNGGAKKSYDDLTQSILQNARATAAKAKIEDLERQRLDSDFQKNKITIATNNEKAKAKDETQSGNAIVGGLAPTTSTVNTRADQIATIESRKRIALQKEQQKQDSIDQQEKFLIAFAGEKNITKTIADEYNKRGSLAGASVQDYLKKYIDAVKQGNDLSLQEELKFNEAVAGTDAFGLQQRTISAKRASEIRLQIIEQDKQAELNKLKVEENEAAKSFDKQQENLNKNTKLHLGERNAIESDLNSQRGVATKYFEQERQNIITKSDNAINEENLKSLTQLGNIYKQERDKLSKLVPAPPPEPIDTNEVAFEKRFETQKHSLEQQAVISATFFAEEQNKLDTAHRKGLLSDKEYAKATIENQKKAIAKQVENLQQQLASLFSENSDLHKKKEELLSLLNINEIITPNDVEGQNKIKTQIAGIDDAIQKNNDAINKSNDSVANLQASTNKLGETKLDKLRDVFEEIGEIVNKVSDILGQAFSNSITKQKNALQVIEDQQEINYENQVERINNGTENEKDKEAQLIAIEAKRQTEKEKNARSDRAIARKQAEFDKIANIGRIVTTGALLILDSFLKYGPAGLIIASTLVGAELAVAATAPIPSYKTLTENHPGGLYIFGDRPDKKPEVAIEPTGEMYAANTPTMRSGQKGLKVVLLEDMLRPLAEDDYKRKLFADAMRVPAPIGRKTRELETGLIELIDETKQSKQILKRMARQNRNQPIVVNVTDNSYYLKQIKGM